MSKFTVYVEKTVYQVWEVEAKDENEARIIYDIDGECKSEKVETDSVDVDSND